MGRTVKMIIKIARVCCVCACVCVRIVSFSLSICRLQPALAYINNRSECARRAITLHATESHRCASILWTCFRNI